MLLCHGMSCYVRGSQDLVQTLADNYGIGDGGTTEDGGLTVQVVNGCLGVCDKAPIVCIDHHHYFGDLDTGSFNDLVQEVLAGKLKEGAK